LEGDAPIFVYVKEVFTNIAIGPSRRRRLSSQQHKFGKAHRQAGRQAGRQSVSRKLNFVATF